jgi:hypothetical protein
VTRRSAAGRLAIGLAGALIAGGVSWWVDGRDGEGTTVPLDMFLLLAALNVIMVIRDAARSAPQDGGAPRGVVAPRVIVAVAAATGIVSFVIKATVLQSTAWQATASSMVLAIVIVCAEQISTVATGSRRRAQRGGARRS